MALDSLGLGLTLDTTLLEKADKTLENMQKNSKLIMQNLTRGFTAFNEGKIGDFTKVFENMSKAMDKINNTTVSLDFDTSGLQKGLGYISQVTTEIEKMQRTGAKQFFNPNELYTTMESTAEVSSRLNNLYAYAERLGQVLKILSEYPQKIRDTENEIAKIDSLLKRTKAGSEKNNLYSQQKLEVETALKKMQNELAETKRLFGDLDSARIAERGLKEVIEITQQQLAWTKKTKAEQLAAITSYNNKIIADEKARTKEVETLYRNNFAEIQKISKAIAQLEADREKIAKGGGDTTEQDTHLAFYRDQLQKRIELEEEITRSGYQKIAKIKEELNAKAFLDSSKQQVKDLQTEVSFANRFSKNAKSVEEERQAIELLRSARNNLSKDTAHYSQIVEALNKRILTHKDHIESVTREEKEQNTLADSVINRYRKQLKALDDVNEALEKQIKIERKTSVADLDPTNADTQALLARQKTIADDIADIESRAQGQLDTIREQHEAERAKKRIDETLRQNEREKQEYAKLLDDLYALEKQKKAMKDAGANVGNKAYYNLLLQEADLKSRKRQLEAKHQTDLDEIQKKHNKKRNDDDVKAFIEAEKEKQKAALESLKKRVANEKKYGTISSATAERLISFTDTATNVAQHKKAIGSLQKARERLDNTDEKYYITLKKIEDALRRHHKELRLAGVESNNLMQSHRGLLNIGGQLARRLALVFSVSQLTQYFRKLVEVRGQFEKTEVALTSIIGDNQKAEKLMNQTIALAIKSPFTLQQLTSYTKQLAAYQVSYEELHSTTKMLADVSAGLGVEMDRLILAFGQVKAANYLRATEVRQFTEAGFNILGELAKYYSELEGRMLSVGDVQEMVTKRMVDFADVEEVFHRVTEAGGMFFDMQSKQAETLAGQWTNLQDRIDVMLNEIGSDNEGVLKVIVSTLVSLIDNWEALADVLKIVIGAFALYKMNLLAVTKAQITNSIAARAIIKEEIKMLGLTKGLSAAWKGLGLSVNFTNGAMKKFFAANAWLLALTAILSVIASVISHFNKLNDAVDENTRAFSNNRSEVKKLAEEYSELNSALSEAADKEKKLAIIEDKRAKLQELSVKLRERGLKLTDSEGNIVDPKSIDASLLDELFTSNKEKLDDAYKLGEELGESITRGLNAAQGNILGFSFFGENLQEDAEDLGQAYGKIASHTFSAYMDDVEADIHNNYERLSQRSQTLYKELAEGRKAEKNDKGEVVKWLESEYDWTKRRLHLLQEISFIDKKTLGIQLKLNNARANLANAESEFSHELEGVLNRLIEKYGSIEALKKEYEKNPQVISAAIKTEVDKQSWDESVKWFAEQDLHAQLTIEYNYVEVVSSETPQKVYEGFKKDLIEARTNLEKAGKGYSNFFISTEDIDKMEQFTDGLGGLQKAYDENIKKRESLKDTTTEEGKAELLMVNAIIAEVKRLAAAWGYTLETKGGKGKDEVLEKLKNRINLIKEMNKEYERLNKTFSKAESLAKVQKAYADTAKELGLDASTMDFTDEGTIKSLEALLGKPEYAAKKYVVELQKALDNFKVELGIEVKQEKDADLKAQVQELFDQYDSSVELKKLNIPKDLAKSLFNVDYLDLEGLKKAVQDQKAKFIGTDMEDEYKKFLEKIDDLEEKQQKESAKRFVEFLTKNLDQTKVVLEQKGIDISYAKSQFDKGAISAQSFAEVVREITKRANEDISKINFKKFKDSSLYIKAMGDLAAYSKKELDKMTEALSKVLAENAKNMSVEELEAYHKALEKIRKEREKFDPFIRDNEIAKIIELKKLEKELANEEKNRKELEGEKVSLEQRRTSLLRLLEEAQSKGNTGEAQSTKNLQDQLLKTEGEIEQVNSLLDNSAINISNISGQIGKITGGAIGAIAMIDMIVQAVNETCNAVKKTFEDIMSMADSFGVETDKGSWREASMFFEGMSNFNAEVTEGWENLKSGNIIGTIANTIGSIVGFIRDVNKWIDSNLEEALQEHLEEVERLEKEYERLERAIDKAFAFERYGKVAEQTSNLAEQAQNLNKAIALEEDKKDTDPERIKELKDQVEDIENQVEDLFDNLKQELIGSFEDMGDSLADAMIEAFKAGEDGLEAWNKEVDSIIAELVKKLTVQKYLEPQISAAIDTLFSRMMPKTAAAEKAAEQYGAASDEAVAAYKKAEGELPQLDKNSAEEFKRNLELIGLSYEEIAKLIAGITGGEAGGLSALQKGISSISEQTAQVLEAYLNSVRMYVATISADTTSQLNEVKAIHRLLDSVTRGGHPMGGAGFKVFMD